MIVGAWFYCSEFSDFLRCIREAAYRKSSFSSLRCASDFFPFWGQGQTRRWILDLAENQPLMMMMMIRESSQLWFRLNAAPFWSWMWITTKLYLPQSKFVNLVPYEDISTSNRCWKGENWRITFHQNALNKCVMVQIPRSDLLLHLDVSDWGHSDVCCVITPALYLSSYSVFCFSFFSCLLCYHFSVLVVCLLSISCFSLKWNVSCFLVC